MLTVSMHGAPRRLRSGTLCLLLCLTELVAQGDPADWYRVEQPYRIGIEQQIPFPVPVADTRISIFVTLDSGGMLIRIILSPLPTVDGGHLVLFMEQRAIQFVDLSDGVCDFANDLILLPGSDDLVGAKRMTVAILESSTGRLLAQQFTDLNPAVTGHFMRSKVKPAPPACRFRPVDSHWDEIVDRAQLPPVQPAANTSQTIPFIPTLHASLEGGEKGTGEIVIRLPPIRAPNDTVRVVLELPQPLPGSGLHGVTAAQVDVQMREAQLETFSQCEGCHPLDDPPDLGLFKMFWANPVKRNGFFVELGAYNGVDNSNTLFFEKHLGWGGVLIEPEPNNFAQCRDARPGATTLNMASMHADVRTLRLQSVCREDGMVTFEGSGQVGGITDYVFDEHRRSYAEWFQKAPIQVLCGPFGKYLRVVGVKRIDLLSIDVEGAELDVLETMDWTIPVHVIIIELVVNDDGGSVRAEKTWALLKDKGFRFRGAAPAMFSSHKVSEISAVDEVWINDAYPQ